MTGARPVTKPLPANRRKKAATGAAAATGAETADSCDESEESDIQFEDRAKVDMALSSSGSERSVDTDVESGVEMEPLAAAATGAPGDELPPLAAAAAGAPDSDDADTASDDGGNVRWLYTRLATGRSGSRCGSTSTRFQAIWTLGFT